MKQTGLQLTMMTPQQVLYRGQAQSVTSINDKGLFDILPQHANFISLIKQRLTFKEMDGTIRQLDLEDGVMEVTEDTVKVFLGLGVKSGL